MDKEAEEFFIETIGTGLNKSNQFNKNGRYNISVEEIYNLMTKFADHKLTKKDEKLKRVTEQFKQYYDDTRVALHFANLHCNDFTTDPVKDSIDAGLKLYKHEIGR